MSGINEKEYSRSYNVGDATANILDCIQLGERLYSKMSDCMYDMYGRMADDDDLLKAYLPFKEYMMKQLTNSIEDNIALDKNHRDGNVTI